MTHPLCRYCGKKIAKRTTTVRFVAELKEHMKRDGYLSYVVGRPSTKAEAQRLVNQQIVSVKRGRDPWNLSAGDYIHEVGVWDGESYEDEFFCNGRHAQLFGYAAARMEDPFIVMPAYAAAAKKRDS